MAKDNGEDLPKNYHKFYMDLNKLIPDEYFLHISGSEIKLTKSQIKKMNIKQSIFLKPIGMWLSGRYNMNEQSWIDWAIHNMQNVVNPISKFYAVKVNYDHIYVVDSVKKLYKFNSIYFDSTKKYIDWAKLKRNGYYGVQFKPYFKKELMKSANSSKYLWYYSLDCASICIWNGKAILDLYLIDTDKLKKKYNFD